MIDEVADDAKTSEGMREATLNPNINVSLRGWNDEDENEARTLGHRMIGLAREISKACDLSHLRSIVIGCDYQEALHSVKLEGEDDHVATANEFATGAAMAVHQKLDGELWSTVVIWTPLVRNLFEDGHPDSKLAFQTFLHELMHVADVAKFTATFPGGWENARPENERDGHLQAIGNPLRSEYFAQRGAAWVLPEFGFGYIDLLEEVVGKINDQIVEARAELDDTGDLAAFWEAARSRVSFLFQSMGYALGHVDGILCRREDDDEHAAVSEKYEKRLEELQRYPSGWVVAEAAEQGRRFFEMEKWSGMKDFEPLTDLVERYLNFHGVETFAVKDKMELRVVL